MKLEAPSLAALEGIGHGFLGRPGGVSEGIYASLNVGLRSGDAVERVLANRARAAVLLGALPGQLAIARQVHGIDAHRVVAAWAAGDAPAADALVTTVPGVLLGVVCADCLPVLLADPGAGVIAAAHAGWRGTLDGVLESAVAAMVAAGATRRTIRAAIGPAIALASYEVGSEYRERFIAQDEAASTFFSRRDALATWHFDLPGYAGSRLRRAGIDWVELLPHDTCGEPERFFSNRRALLDGVPAYGLQLSGIMLSA